QILKKLGPQKQNVFRAVQQRVDLKIGVQTAEIEVGGTDRSHQVVANHDFGVQKPPLVQINFDTGLQQFVKIRRTGPIHKHVVRPGRKEQLDVHPPQGGGFQRHQERIVGDEIRGRDEQFVLGLVDHGKIRLSDALPFLVRTAGNDLHAPSAFRLDSRKIDRI